MCAFTGEKKGKKKNERERKADEVGLCDHFGRMEKGNKKRNEGLKLIVDELMKSYTMFAPYQIAIKLDRVFPLILFEQ